VETNELKVTQQLLEIPKTENKRCIQQWKRSWNKGIQSERAYFEGD
jgi:hypothetical protein